MSLLDPVKLEKILLARRVGRFLSSKQDESERAIIEGAALKLASDKNESVREVLAFELRKCTQLDPRITEKIARDVEAVAAPFLTGSCAMSDEQVADLIPVIADYARAALALRSDLGPKSVLAIAQEGEEESVSRLVRNDNLVLDAECGEVILSRFASHRLLMDQLSDRIDLPRLIVEELMDKVSEHCTQKLQTYLKEMDETRSEADPAAGLKPVIAAPSGAGSASGKQLDSIWARIESASPQQVHAFVMDLRTRKKLTIDITAEMAERGAYSFFESSFALIAGLPLQKVRDIFSLENPSEFVGLMKEAKVPTQLAPKFLKIVKTDYAEYRANVTRTAEEFVQTR